jgi:hypothetical protein
VFDPAINKPYQKRTWTLPSEWRFQVRLSLLEPDDKYFESRAAGLDSQQYLLLPDHHEERMYKRIPVKKVGSAFEVPMSDIMQKEEHNYDDWDDKDDKDDNNHGSEDWGSEDWGSEDWGSEDWDGTDSPDGNLKTLILARWF